MRHYKRIALAFGNDIGSQTFIQPAIAAIKKAGMTLVANETLDLSSTTFRTEAAKIVAAKPDVILTEALGPTEAAFLSEVKQLNGGKLIAGDRHLGDDLARLVQVGVGRRRREHAGAGLLGRQPGDRDERARLPGVLDGDLRREGQGREHGRLLDLPDRAGRGAPVRRDQPGGAGDDRNRKAPPRPCSVPYIEKIGDGVPGATVVYSFAQGAAALKAGKQIRYEGPGGPTSFDAYHDSAGIFQVDTYTRRRHGEGRRQPAPTSRAARARALSATVRSRLSTRAGDVSVFVASIGFGLVTAAVLALASVGFTLQFAVTNVLNLAYGGS